MATGCAGLEFVLADSTRLRGRNGRFRNGTCVASMWCASVIARMWCDACVGSRKVGSEARVYFWNLGSVPTSPLPPSLRFGVPGEFSGRGEAKGGAGWGGRKSGERSETVFRVGERCGAVAPTRKKLRIFRPPHKGEVN